MTKKSEYFTRKNDERNLYKRLSFVIFVLKEKNKIIQRCSKQR